MPWKKYGNNRRIVNRIKGKDQMNKNRRNFVKLLAASPLGIFIPKSIQAIKIPPIKPQNETIYPKRCNPCTKGFKTCPPYECDKQPRKRNNSMYNMPNNSTPDGDGSSKPRRFSTGMNRTLQKKKFK